MLCYTCDTNFSVATSQDDCIDCPAGKFCSGESADGFTGDCSPGYYCSGGAYNSTQFPAQAGYYAEAGAEHPVACDPG